VLAWWTIAALLAAQFVLFVTTARREVTWFVPMSYDQCTYLLFSYGVYEHMQENGIASGIDYGLKVPSMPTGSLLHVVAPLVFLVFGPSRLAALSINFALYALCQCCLAGTLAWYTKRWSAAFLGLGLFLTALAPFFYAGGLFDFRLDFGGFCLFCVMMCSVVRSGFFMSRRWALVVGLAAATLALYRHLTIVYLTGIFGICLLFVLARMAWQWRNTECRRRALRQLTSGAMAAVIIATVTMPALLAKWDYLWNYYVIGHLLGEEKKVREAEVGVTNRFESYLFYLKSADYHTGTVFWYAAGACAGIGLTLCLALWLRRVLSRKGTSVSSVSGAPGTDTALAWVFFLACLLVPYAVLTADIAKSYVPGNVLAVSLLWLALLPALALARRNMTGIVWRSAGALCAIAAVTCGLLVQQHAYAQHQFSGDHPEDAAQIVALQNNIVRHCADAGLKRPNLASDFIVEFLCAPVTSVWAYETQGKMLPVDQTAGLSILLADDKAIFDALHKSDFVLLTNGSPYASDAYPFHQRMKELRPKIAEYCERELVRLQSYTILNTTIQLYARPGIGQKP